MAYQGLAIEELAAEYNPRLAVPDNERWRQHWALAAAWTRERRPEGRLRIPYGDTPAQRLDAFPAAQKGAPIHVFVHGGFWRFLDSLDHSFLADSTLDAGGAAVLINYDLCPSVALPEIIPQIRRAIAWVYAHASELNGDPDRITVSGHSAGGHLAGLMGDGASWEALGLPRDAVKSLVCVSGIYDLAPMQQIPDGADLRLTPETAQAASTIQTPPDPEVPVLIAYGGQETNGFHHQATMFAEICQERGSDAVLLEAPNDHHYSILFSLANPTTALGAALLERVGL